MKLLVTHRRRGLGRIRAAVRNAVRCHFEDKDLPRMIRLHIVRNEVMAV